MHELSVATTIIDKAQRLLKENNAEKALAIYIKIGELSSIEKDNLEFCYDILAREISAFKECRLIIEETAWMVKCKHCDTTYNPNQHVLRCPNCDSQDSTMISGNELDLVSMEAE
jgi:hydrogenase nickel incorporation protein HypA/HybF